jgi:hypothetical protein
MQYKMLFNWRCGAYYVEGETYDLSKAVPAIDQKTIDEAVKAGYMIAVPDLKSAAIKTPPLETKTPPLEIKK